MKNRIALTLLAVVALPALVSCGAASVADAPMAFAPTTSNVESNALFSKAIQVYGETFMAKYDADKDGKIAIGKQVFTKMGVDLAALKENVQLKKESIALLKTKGSIFSRAGIACHELQPLLAAADADKDGAATMDELKAFIKKTFDRNNNDQLGLFERIRFRFSQFKERNKKLKGEEVGAAIPPAQTERLRDEASVPSVEKIDDVDQPALPTAEEQEALNS